MSRHLTFILLSCLAIAGCSDRAKQERRQRNREFLMDFLGGDPPKSYRETDGFQNTWWGMSAAEVGMHYSEAWKTPAGDVGVELRITNRPALVEFLFAEDRLAAVSVHFVHPEGVREHFEPLAEILELKYGPPASHLDTGVLPGGDLDETTPNAPKSTLRLERTWRADETFIRLIGVHQPCHQSLTIHYESARLNPLLDKTPRSLEVLQQQAREYHWRAQVKEL
ncbi:hypothetical protein [Myxococcus landrumensis]|uniref:Lipoprotein n=1 Tax=Myxococcus landrumensis TaxID=2813577 RepID=A0ABX7N694_9BACT|nr:hypothetical protein [Myxococcus landrumus]QSQ12946.1 hypothetical protein JY572_32055 [Myxococcus landrumus]